MLVGVVAGLLEGDRTGVLVGNKVPDDDIVSFILLENISDDVMTTTDVEFGEINMGDFT